MSVVQSHGRVQAGVLLVPRNLTDEEKSRVGAIAVQSEGNRSMTCLYENLSILATAGFTIDDRESHLIDCLMFFLTTFFEGLL